MGGILAETENSNICAAISQNLKGKKILVVDDTIDNQILEKMYLMSAGADVDLADSGEEGVQKALQVNYDVILMDLHMPVVDGFKATKQLRKKGFQKPIIAVTANTLPETKHNVMNGGFNEYLTKPLSRKTLLDTIDQIFAKSELDAIRKSLLEITEKKQAKH